MNKTINFGEKRVKLIVCAKHRLSKFPSRSIFRIKER